MNSAAILYKVSESGHMCLCVLLQTGPPVEELPPPPLPAEPPVESAWERGLRHAKEVRANLVKTLIRVFRDFLGFSEASYCSPANKG